jgi:mRNA-decapping enzyme subunit 2
LAMFRGSNASPPAPLLRKEPAIMSSLEQEVPMARAASLSRTAVQRSPLGKEKDGLMAYLETVAKEGGH